MIEHAQQQTSNHSFVWKYLTHFALALSLIADTYTLASIFAIRNGDHSTFPFMPINITPLHSLGIWILAAFIYIGFLQSYWIENRGREGFQSTFVGFLLRDLISGFRKPFLIFPGVFALLLLIWIGLESIVFLGGVKSLQDVATTIFCTIPFGLLFIGMFLFRFLYVISTEGMEKSRKVNQFRYDVDTNWSTWDKRVQVELSKKWCVGTWNLQDMAKIWGIEGKEISYVLAKYAAAHPRSTAYGYVFDSESGKLAFDEEILTSHKTIPRDKYYVGR